MTDPRLTRKLAELCDGDRRVINDSTRAVATAIPTPSPDSPMPDPYAEHDATRQIMALARQLLQAAPSARSARATGRRLIAALSNLTDQVSKEVGDGGPGN